MVVSTVKSKIQRINLESTVWESAQEKKIPQLNSDWECIYQRHCSFIFHVISHILFLINTEGKCYLNNLLERDILELELNRIAVSVMQQCAILVCSPDLKCRGAKHLSKDQLALRALLLPHLGFRVTANLYVAALKTFNQGASQHK